MGLSVASRGATENGTDTSAARGCAAARRRRSLSRSGGRRRRRNAQPLVEVERARNAQVGRDVGPLAQGGVEMALHRRAQRRDIAIEGEAPLVALEGAGGRNRADAALRLTGRHGHEPARIRGLQREARKVEMEILAQAQRPGGPRRGAEQGDAGIAQRKSIHGADHAAGCRRGADLPVREFRQAGIVDDLVGVGHGGVEGQVVARRRAEIGHRAADIQLGAQQIGDLGGGELQHVGLHRCIGLDAAQRLPSEDELGDLGLEAEHGRGLVGWRGGGGCRPPAGRPPPTWPRAHRPA